MIQINLNKLNGMNKEDSLPSWWEVRKNYFITELFTKSNQLFIESS